MTLADATSLTSLANWKDEGLYIKEFVHKKELPQIVRIVKGHYQGLGASSGLTNTCSVFLLMCLGKKKRIHAQSVKFKENRKVNGVGPKLSIPSTYEGYFEILSEDGRSVRCIESVAELIRRFPDSVLVRENIRAFVSKGDDVEAVINSSSTSRIINAGEILLLVGQVSDGTNSAKFLRCFDSQGENVFLPHDLRGKFSAIAKEDNISGVHTVSNLLNKRLPLMARLAHGLCPPIGLRSSQTFHNELRLFNSIEEEMLVALTLTGKECQIIPLPLPVLIKVQAASNFDVISQTSEFKRLTSRCLELGQDIVDKIVVYDVSIGGKDIRLNGVDNKHQKNNNHHQQQQQASTQIQNGQHGGRDEYDEIEQIYDYVRGFAPLPKGAKGWKYESAPEPPPLETLPSRKQSASIMDLSTPPPPPTPAGAGPYSSAPWMMGSSQYINHLHLGDKQRPVTAPDNKKRSKKSGNGVDKNKSNENKNPSDNIHHHHHPTATIANMTNTTPTTSHLRNRFVKSANYRQIGQKHKFFRSTSSSKQKGSTNHHPTSTSGMGGDTYSSPIRPSTLFNLRYKSLTNLTGSGSSNVVPQHMINSSTAEYDTLDSSNSGGKTSGGDSGASRNLPEKRSRKLSRPKSLTNLVWGNNSSSNNNNDKNTERRKLEPGVYTHRRLSKELSSSTAIHGRKLGSAGATSGKRIGTLYL